MAVVILAIQIDGDTIEEESRLARIIAEGLVDRGFPSVEIAATETVYRSPKLGEQAQEAAPKDTPIMTMSNAIH